MEHPQPIPRLLKRLWIHIHPRRRKQFGLLLVLMVLASFAEILSIGAVLPFLGALTAPQVVFLHPLLQPLFARLGFTSPDQLLLPLTIAFGCASLLSGGMRLFLLWASTRLTYAAGADLSSSIYQRTLYQPYAVHVARNSSEVISGISSKANEVIYGVMTPVLVMLSSAAMLSAILVALFTINPAIALTAFCGFGLIYVMVVKLARKRLLNNSQRIARESTQVIKSLQEGLGGIRDVLIDGTQSIYCDIYRAADLPLRRAQGENLFIASFPRYGIESLGMLLIAALAYVLAKQPGGIATAIPVLGALALGAQRMLPVLQQAYGSWTAMRASQSTFQDVLDLMDQSLPDYAGQLEPDAISFQKEITLENVAFRYSFDAGWVLQDVHLTIHKGERIGFMGTTGSGKSTLLDVVMALLQPTQGNLRVDGVPVNTGNLRSWQAHIAHVPQSIYLADASIAANIAFGVPIDQIDMVRVRHAALQAQIAQTIEGWDSGYLTSVGERGVRLSGGQRQRIGIARALYKRADVIVFDEATSALDVETEDAVMRAIDGLSSDLTLIMIAHRLSTLSGCSRIVELEAGRVTRIGTQTDILKTDLPFSVGK
jgi:ABC-type multidrug transport system fused ATPase/permease subunit